MPFGSQVHENYNMTIGKFFTLNPKALFRVAKGPPQLLSGEIEGRGVKISKKLNFVTTIRYKIPTFLTVGPF